MEMFVLLNFLNIIPYYLFRFSIVGIKDKSKHCISKTAGKYQLPLSYHFALNLAQKLMLIYRKGQKVHCIDLLMFVSLQVEKLFANFEKLYFY